MTTIEPDHTDDRTAGPSRRRLLVGAVAVGGAAIAGGAIGGGVAAASSANGSAFRRDSLVVEVACLGETWREAEPKYSTDESDFRGYLFSVEGYIYPEGTVGEGDGYVPSADGAIGRWFCRGATLAYIDRPEPHLQSTQEHAFGPVDREQLFPPIISSIGLEGTATDQVAMRSVVGGTHEWMGASGQAAQTQIGCNTSEFTDGSGNAPNFRFEFDLLLPTL